MANDDQLRPENSPASPGITDKPKINVRGLSPLPILLAALVVGIVVFFIAWGIQKRGQDNSSGNQDDVVASGDRASKGGINEWLQGAPEDGMIPNDDAAGTGNTTTQSSQAAAPQRGNEADSSAPASASSNSAPQRRQGEQQSPEDQMMAELRQQRMDNMMSALASDTSVKTDSGQSGGGQSGGGQYDGGQSGGGQYDGGQYDGGQSGGGQYDGGQYDGGQSGGGQSGGGAMGLVNQQSDYQSQNMQDSKQTFLNGRSQGQDEFRSRHTRQAQQSPYSIKTGTVIPGVMISGINSDLPGRMIAQVSQDVYSSADEGEHLMIPQGARLYGKYDSNVAMGQERVLIVWDRVIYPDGSTLTLDSMPGSDQEGYAGFHDQVDNHYWRTFGNALLLSVISGAAQLSQPNSGGSDDGYDASQIMAAQLGQQFGQVGQEMIRQNMNIQPTLKIRKGYRFNVMVTKDIVAEPWRQ